MKTKTIPAQKQPTNYAVIIVLLTWLGQFCYLLIYSVVKHTEDSAIFEGFDYFVGIGLLAALIWAAIEDYRFGGNRVKIVIIMGVLGNLFMTLVATLGFWLLLTGFVLILLGTVGLLIFGETGMIILTLLSYLGIFGSIGMVILTIAAVVAGAMMTQW